MSSLGRNGGFWVLLLLLLLLGGVEPACGQALPSMPKIGGAEKSESVGVSAAPTADNPEATVAEATGPIAVEEAVSDLRIQETLESLLPRYPGVRSIEVEVDDGVVTLRGHVEDPDTRDRLRDFVRRVEGVKLVLNQTRTDAQMLTARQLASKTLIRYVDLVSRKWLIALLALLVFVGSLALARVVSKFADPVLAVFTENLLLRSVLVSLSGLAVILGGIFTSLTMLGLTEAVLSVVGLAGVVALAVGFAFRDIAENFISSILLGVRRPFRVGDFVEVAGKAGFVRSLNTRATILLTLEGHLVRIPNATVFKEITVNKTATNRVRRTFDLVVTYEASTARAIEIITRVLRSQDGVLADPPARVIVEDLAPSGVKLRAFFWTPAQGIDDIKLLSDAKLATKVSLQSAGIAPAAPSTLTVSFDPTTLERLRPRTERSREQEAAGVTAREKKENLQRDTKAVAEATLESSQDGHNPFEKVMKDVSAVVTEEGENLLKRSDEEEDQPRESAPTSEPAATSSL